MNVFIVFCICSLINVVLSTTKSLVMINCSRNSAIMMNAISYGFYTLVVKQLASVDYLTAVIVTILSNIIGVWLSYKVMDITKKDKVWRITVHIKNTTECADVIKQLGQYNISCTAIPNSNNVDIYSYNQNESNIVKSILSNYKHKYFIQEMSKSL